MPLPKNRNDIVLSILLQESFFQDIDVLQSHGIVSNIQEGIILVLRILTINLAINR